MVLDKHKFSLTPLGATTLTPTRTLETRPNTFGVALYELLHKTPELANWNSFATNDNAEIWTTVQEAGTATKTEMSLNITGQAPIVTAYETFTTVPTRLWGIGDKDYFLKTRQAIGELLVNRLRIQQLSQICWGSVEGTLPTSAQSLKSIWGNPLTMTAGTIAPPSLIEGLNELVAEYMANSGRYPEVIVLNDTAMAYIADSADDIAEAIVGLNRLYDTKLMTIPDFSPTNVSPKVIMGDFGQYYMYQPQNGGTHEVDLEGHDHHTNAQTITYQSLNNNTTELLIEEVCAGAVMTGSTFLQATFAGLTQLFTLNISELDGQDVIA